MSPAPTEPDPPAHAHGCGCGHDHADHDHHHHGHHHHHEHDHDHSHELAAHIALADSRLRTLLRGLILMLWGGVMIYFFTSGRIVSYLTSDGFFRIQCLIAGLILVVVALFNWLNRAETHDDCHDCHEEDESLTASSSWSGFIFSAALLCVPIGASALYTPDRFSDEFSLKKLDAVTALKKNNPQAAALPAAASTPPLNKKATGTFTVEDLVKETGGRSPDGHIKLQLIEIYMMPAQKPDVREVVSSQTVETIGQLIKDKNNQNKPKLFRMMVTCCAADARPIAVPVEFPPDTTPAWKELGWYKLSGKITYREENGAPVAIFEATSVSPEKAPRAQFLF
jgi:uncharacterized repeat protein (TIGR03943 family)